MYNIEANIGVSGVMTLRRYDRETGRFLGEKRKNNAVTAAGLTLLLNLWTNNSSVHVSQANATILIYNSADAHQRTFSGATSGPDHTVSQNVDWVWEDNTVDVYEADDIHVSNGATVFSVTDTNFGTKPSSENWHYTYTLNLTSIDGNINSTGLDYLLRTVSGNSSAHFNNLASSITVRDGSNNIEFTEIGCDAGYPSISGGTATFRWVIPAPGGIVSHVWNTVEVFVDYGPPRVTIRSGGPSQGTQASNAEWVFTYTFTLAAA